MGTLNNVADVVTLLINVPHRNALEHIHFVLQLVLQLKLSQCGTYISIQVEPEGVDIRLNSAFHLRRPNETIDFVVCARTTLGRSVALFDDYFSLSTFFKTSAGILPNKPRNEPITTTHRARATKDGTPDDTFLKENHKH